MQLLSNLPSVTHHMTLHFPDMFSVSSHSILKGTL